MVFRGGALVAQANNTTARHAERRALRRVSHLKNLVVLSVRVSKSGELRNAKPCSDCWELLKQSGVNTVMWSNDKGQIERERLCHIEE